MPEPRYARYDSSPAARFLGTFGDMDVWQRTEAPYSVETLYFDGDKLGYSLAQLERAPGIEWVEAVLKLVKRHRDPSISPNA